MTNRPALYVPAEIGTQLAAPERAGFGRLLHGLRDRAAKVRAMRPGNIAREEANEALQELAAAILALIVVEASVEDDDYQPP